MASKKKGLNCFKIGKGGFFKGLIATSGLVEGKDPSKKGGTGWMGRVSGLIEGKTLRKD